VSFFSALTVLCTLRALAVDDPVSRQRNWIAAGTALLLCYHSKVTGLLLAPVVALISWVHRDRVRDFNRFLVTVVLLFGASAIVFLGMEFNVQRAAGYWVRGFRNARHAHVFVYPLVLLLTGYLVALRAKRPALATAAVVVLLVTASVAAVSTATKTQTAFADG